MGCVAGLHVAAVYINVMCASCMASYCMAPVYTEILMGIKHFSSDDLFEKLAVLILLSLLLSLLPQ